MSSFTTRREILPMANGCSQLIIKYLHNCLHIIMNLFTTSHELLLVVKGCSRLVKKYLHNCLYTIMNLFTTKMDDVSLYHSTFYFLLYYIYIDFVYNFIFYQSSVIFSYPMM